MILALSPTRLNSEKKEKYWTLFGYHMLGWEPLFTVVDHDWVKFLSGQGGPRHTGTNHHLCTPVPPGRIMGQRTSLEKSDVTIDSEWLQYPSPIKLKVPSRR